jgi:tetratricopeptide (TPR) repeat protein
MGTSIRFWVESNRRPGDLYELLGRLRFDPDIHELRDAVRAAYAELLLYQNHSDPHIAQRVNELQRELGAAEAVLSDPVKLHECETDLLVILTAMFAEAKAASKEDWSLPRLRLWLNRQQRVHPERVETIAEAVLLRAGQESASGHMELEEDRGLGLADPGDSSDSEPAKNLPKIQPDAVAPPEIPKRGRAPAAAMIGILASGKRDRSTAVADAAFLRSRNRQGRNVLRRSLWITAAVLLVGGLGGIGWLIVSRWPAGRQETPPAVCRLTIEPTDACVEVLGQEVSIVGRGRERSVIIPHPNAATKLVLIATMDGYQPEKRELSPSPGTEQDIRIRMRPLLAASQAEKKPVDAAVPVDRDPGVLAKNVTLPGLPPAEKTSSDVVIGEEHGSSSFARSAPVTSPQGGNDAMPEIGEAVARFRNRDFDAALAILKRAVAKNPDLPPAHVVMARLFAKANDKNMVRVALEKAASEAPADPEAFILLAELALREGHVAEASATLSKARELLAPFRGSVKRRDFMTLALANTSVGIAEARKDWPLAKAHLEEILNDHPNDVQALQRYARVLFQQEKRQEALDVLAKAKKIDSQVLLPEARLALFSEQNGDHRTAKRWMADALRIAPRDVRACLAAGQWAWETREFADAQKYSARAVQMAPDLSEAAILRGVVALFQKDYETAELYFERANLESPNRSAITSHLALALCEQSDFAKVRRALEYASINARKNPKDRDAICTYAWVLYKAGLIHEAEQHLRQGLSQGGATSDDAFIAALILLDQGHKGDVRQLLEKALRSPGPFRKRPESIALLTEVAPDSSWAFHAGDTVVVYTTKATISANGEGGKPAPAGTLLRVVEIRKKKLLVELDGRRGSIEMADVMKTDASPPISPAPAKSAMRRWTDATGRYLTQAEFVDIKNGMVALRRTDGSVIQVELEKLSDHDRRHIESLTASITTSTLAADPEPSPETGHTDITRRYVVRANRLDPGQAGAITLRNPVATLRIRGVITDLITPGDTSLELTGKGAKVADLTFAGPCDLTVGKDWTLLAPAKDVMATDARGKVWRTRSVSLAGKEVFAFFLEEPKRNE